MLDPPLERRHAHKAHHTRRVETFTHRATLQRPYGTPPAHAMVAFRATEPRCAALPLLSPRAALSPRLRCLGASARRWLGAAER